jgi:hypothetical protein
MNDVAEPKLVATPKPPMPICTLLSDGSIQVEQEQISMLDMQRMLLVAAGNITGRVMQRAAGLERTLTGVYARYSFNEETDRVIRSALSPETES